MSLDNHIKLLASSELFKDFSPAALLKLFENIDYTIKKYGKDDIIFIEDDECTTLSIILKGIVEIQRIDTSGKLMKIAEFTFGDVFGEVLIFSDHSRYPMTVSCKADSVVMHISRTSIVKLCQTETSFLYAYLRMISNKAYILNKKLKEVTLKTIRQKISEYIYNQSIKQNSLTVHVNMTKKEWADLIGVQRPSLSRELIRMKDEGIIDYDKDQIIIMDLDALEDFI